MPSSKKGLTLKALFLLNLIIWTQTVEAGLGQSLTPAFFINTYYDDNVFRYSADELAKSNIKPSDELSTLGLSISGDFQKRKQKFDAQFTLYKVNFLRNDYLNYWGGTGLASWGWAYGRRFTGKLALDVSYKRSENADYSSLNDKVRLLKQTFNIQYQLGINTRLSLNTYVRQLRHSATQLETANSQIVSVRPEFHLHNKSQSEISSFVELAFINYPDRVRTPSLDDQSALYKIGIATRIVSGPSMRANAQVGFTQRKNAHIKDRDYSGLTGYIQFFWNPREKFRANVKLLHDVLASDYYIANYYEVFKISSNNRYWLTSKIQMLADFIWEENNYNSDKVNVNWIENVSKLEVGTAYAINRNFNVQLVARRENRRSAFVERNYQTNQLSFDMLINF